MNPQRQAGQYHALSQLHHLPSPHPEQHSQKTDTRQIDDSSGMPNSKASVEMAKLLTIGRDPGHGRGQAICSPLARSAVSKYCAHARPFTVQADQSDRIQDWTKDQLAVLAGFHQSLSSFRKYGGAR